jgi:phospholipid transport system substrate-binding protein
MNRRLFASLSLGLSALLASALALAGPLAPDVFIRDLSNDILETAKKDTALQNADLNKVIALVDSKIIPHTNFRRMTASAVGRYWRQATPEQQQRLQEEFKLLLVRTYAGALSQVKDMSVHMLPLRARPEDTDVIVRTQVRGAGEPIQMDYRLEKVGDTWKIYDVNVLGIWLVENYRSTFAQEISKGGIDGLINSLAERNRQAAAARS